MATLKITLDKRRKKINGKFPLAIKISHLSYDRFVNLRLEIDPVYWDSDSSKVLPTHPNCAKFNLVLSHYLNMAEHILLEFTFNRPNYPISELYTSIKLYLFPESKIRKPKNDKGQFLSTFENCASLKNGKTKESYLHTLSLLHKWNPSLASLSFNDFLPSTLHSFDNFLQELKNAPNTRSVHFRNLRSVFNFAIDDEITSNYPFRKFKIPKAPTAKRNLKIDSLRRLFNHQVEEWQQEHLDFFKLSFFLIGINPVDLLKLKHSDIHENRIEFRRSKTGKLYSIFIEPEAQELLRKYSGNEYLLAAAERYSNTDDYRRRINKALQSIGNVTKMKGRGGKLKYDPFFPNLTLYWARHTWATIASSLDIPKETIAAALGHSSNTVTDVYIEFDERKIDNANRRVIDYVLYDKR